MDAVPGFTVNPTGLVVTGDPPRGTWAEFGEGLAQRSSTNSWLLGDWLLLGERSWGDVYTQAVEITGYDYGYLRKVRHICKRFSLLRRRNKLTFGHHEAVASLPPAAADRLLDQAEREGLSRARLRELVAGPKTPLIVLDPLTEQLTATIRAASRLRELIDSLLTGPRAGRLQALLQQHHADLEPIVAVLSAFAAEATTGALDEDRATDEDMAAGRIGRRVG